MRREDLFEAIGMVKESQLAVCEKHRNPSVIVQREDSKMHKGKYRRIGKTGRIKKIWLIAAAIILMTLLMGSAIVSLVSMKVDDVRLNVHLPEIQGDENAAFEEQNKATANIDRVETHEGEKVIFEKQDDVFIELGSWYPQEIPEGYTMTFVSEGAPYQNQRIDYENETGKRISYWIYIADPASSVEVYDIVSKTDVEVNGQDGILYEQVGNQRTLVWINEEHGYGFSLRTDDAAVDILAIAKSTSEGEPLKPTRSESTVKAIKQLGDYVPACLPEGYVEQGTLGCPIEEGGGWYSYVRKWFVNKAENKQIYFEYETYRIVVEEGYTDDAKTVCSFYIPGCSILKGVIVGDEVEIDGMYGLATENHIAWADPESHVVYHLYSKDITGEELVKVAQSIVKK